MSPSQKDDDGQGWEDISLPDTKSLHWACRYCRTWNSPERENCVECRRWAERWMGGKRVFDPDVLLPRSELEALISQAIANHRDAQQLRERVRVLEEALREIDAEFDDGADPKTMRRLLDAALLSPAAATEGGDGA